MMKISKNKVVSLDCTIKDESGEIIVSTDTSRPMEYIHGSGKLITALERMLEGKEVGAELKDFVVKPEDAYGEYSQELVAEVRRENFPEDAELEEGMQFAAEGEDFRNIVTITKIEGDKITVDGNHPLAGKSLHFDVKVVAIREATEEEKAFGLEHSCGCGCGDCESGEDDEGCFGGHGNGCCGCGCS